MIPRAITPTLLRLIPQYPAIAITGPRQSGKTTLARMVFPDFPYVSLENSDTLDFAESDTRGFLAQYSNGAVFDEAQRCPKLFSYLQQIIDEGPKHCRFVLTGSQQFGLRSHITQSLAGRVANCTLLPFTYQEWFGRDGVTKPAAEQVLFSGLYPPVLDRKLEKSTWYENYIQNYVERDVRQILSIENLRTFHLFLKMCAARCGQLLNLSALAADCGISVNTAKGWISVLEASYIIFLLQPHFKNFGKRLIKTPKLYFYDTGLVTHLLSVPDKKAMLTHAMRGPVFETFVITEVKKGRFNSGKTDNLYFWRDRAGHEVDLISEDGDILHAAEIKSGKTLTSDSFSGLQFWKTIAAQSVGTCSVVYGGNDVQERTGVQVVPWNEGEQVFVKSRLNR